MKPRRLPFAEFKKIYSRVPRLCVEVIMQTPDGIVLTKRTIAPAKGQWHLPGGTVLKGETLVQTVHRVAKAETGVAVKVEKLLGVIEYRFKGYFSQPFGVAFLVRPLGRKFRTDENAGAIRVFKKLPTTTIAAQSAFIRKHLKI